MNFQSHEPKIAIVVPVYNVARYLFECLNSIDHQTDQRFAVFAVDDGSTDTSGIILDDYAKNHSWLKVFHKKNGGVSSARNFALDQISQQYKYVSFIDSDDTVEPHYVETLICSMEKDNADVGVYQMRRFDKTGFYEEYKPHYEILNTSQVWDACFASEYYGFWSMGTKVFRRDFISGLRFNSKIHIAEDADFFFKLVPNINRCIVIPDFIYNYRLRKSSACNNEHLLLTKDESTSLAFKQVDTSKMSTSAKRGYYRHLFDLEFGTLRAHLLKDSDDTYFKTIRDEILSLPHPKEFNLNKHKFRYKLLSAGYTLNRLHYLISEFIRKAKRKYKKRTQVNKNMFD